MVTLFVNDTENAATVNNEKYWNILYHFFSNKLEYMNPDQLWIQQNGATCNSSEIMTCRIIIIFFCPTFALEVSS